MQPFTTLAAIAVPIDIANCDTDQIIPARFLRRTTEDPQYPRYLFHDLRFNADGTYKDFVFDRAAYRGAKIIVADVNWGCGSSREHAVTALTANGIRAVIAPSFGDIHRSNCIRNGVLPIELAPEHCATLRRQLRESAGAEIAIDLEEQSLTGPDQARYTFTIDAFDKHRLLNGLDDVGMTLAFSEQIDRFEADHTKRHRWTV